MEGNMVVFQVILWEKKCKLFLITFVFLTLRGGLLMKTRILAVYFLILMASFCYCAPANDKGVAASNKQETGQRGEGARYILSPFVGLDLNGISLAGFGQHLVGGALGCDFVYLLPSGFTISSDLAIIIGSMLPGITGGISVNAFVGYSYFFLDKKMMLSLTGGIQNILTSKYISVLGIGYKTNLLL